jgi:F0F1-type ATP synthase assembly protein I
MSKDGGTEEKEPLVNAVNESSKGTDLAASVIVGLVLGWLCQKYWPASRPWGFLGFLFLGIAAGFFQLFRKDG